MKIYVPFADAELILGARLVAEATRGSYHVHGTRNASLAALTRTDTIYVMGHGVYGRGDQIGGTVAGRVYGTRTVYLTAPELTARLIADGLPKHCGDLRLMMCWSGYTGGTTNFSGHVVTRDATQAPFAGQLCSALKAAGFFRMIVTGYTGEVIFSKNPDAVFRGIWLTNERNVLTQTNDDGAKTLTDLMGMIRGPGTRTLSDRNRTVWY